MTGLPSPVPALPTPVRTGLALALQNNSTGALGPETERAVQITADKFLWAVVALALAYLLARTISSTLSVLAGRFAEHRFRVTLVLPVLKFVIYGGTLFLILRDVFDLTQTQLLAFSGLLGAAIGLGLKDFLADVVGGLVVVFEKPYQVGDKVTLGDHYGEIVDIGIRSTKLVTPDDSMVVVPNFIFFNKSITNANTSDAEMMVTVEFYVDPETDLQRATEIVEEALMTSQYVYVDEDHHYRVVVDDELYYRTVRGKAYVNDLRNEIPFRTDVTERVLRKFADEDIESPKVPAGVDSDEGGH